MRRSIAVFVIHQPDDRRNKAGRKPPIPASGRRRGKRKVFWTANPFPSGLQLVIVVPARNLLEGPEIIVIPHHNLHRVSFSLRSWRYCVDARLKFWRRSRVPKKGSREEAVGISRGFIRYFQDKNRPFLDDFQAHLGQFSCLSQQNWYIDCG